MKIIDLTLTLYDGLISYKTHPAVQIKEQSTFEDSKDRYHPPCEGFESRVLHFSDHSGTHIDAPLHFIREGESTAEMKLTNTIGEAVLLDVSGLKEPTEPVTSDMLDKAQQLQNLYVQKEDILLVKTRNGSWGDASFFEELAFDKSAAQWIVEKMVKLVGLDLPNIDIHDNVQRDVHMDVLGNDIYIVENLVNLGSLPKAERFQFFALPLKLKDSTASPVRAIAILK
ncbi:cyclase family protein [bacterium LRH843]|nr:cyclase family protein [bacterium LRH843]